MGGSDGQYRSMTCDELADRYLERYEQREQGSSLGTVRGSSEGVPGGVRRPPGRVDHSGGGGGLGADRAAVLVPRVVALFGYAKRLQVIGREPVRGLGGVRGRGRADLDPPTVQELERLLDACDALGDYAGQMRALIEFAAYTGMRPGERFELRWSDIDLPRNRITVPTAVSRRRRPA